MDESYVKQNSSRKQLLIVNSIIPYRHLNAPLVSEEKKNLIEKKLQLDKKAFISYEDRKSKMDYYIKSNFNPFLEYPPKEAALLKKHYGENNENRKNIVTNLIEKQEIKFKPGVQNLSEEAELLKNKTSMFSDKLLNDLQKNEIDSRKKNQAAQIKQYSKWMLKREEVPYSDSIQSIASFEEKNFFLSKKENTDFNIFKLANGEMDEISSRQNLSKYFFSLTSVFQKISKIKIPIFRDISTLSRAVMVGKTVTKQNIIDYIDSGELSFKLKDLSYEDILSVASGRFSVEFLNRMINDDYQISLKEGSDTSSEENEGEKMIIYRHMEMNKEENFINENEELQQIDEYKKLDLNEVEKEFDKKYILRKNFIKNKIEIKEDLYRNTITDRNLHNDIGKNVQLSLANFMEADESKIDVDRLIRVNKISKSKKQVSKLKNLIETLAAKNKHDNMTKHK